MFNSYRLVPRRGGGPFEVRPAGPGLARGSAFQIGLVP